MNEELDRYLVLNSEGAIVCKRKIHILEGNFEDGAYIKERKINTTGIYFGIDNGLSDNNGLYSI